MSDRTYAAQFAKHDQRPTYADLKAERDALLSRADEDKRLISAVRWLIKIARPCVDALGYSGFPVPANDLSSALAAVEAAMPALDKAKEA